MAADHQNNFVENCFSLKIVDIDEKLLKQIKIQSSSVRTSSRIVMLLHSNFLVKWHTQKAVFLGGSEQQIFDEKTIDKLLKDES